mmetsp:Transcript_3655/g.8103  ORF Transcript_3655/g.8103 Transcript_3655/m.8103 type:complete len:1279 (-) Transcript_3655:212-4048(-)
MRIDEVLASASDNLLCGSCNPSDHKFDSVKNSTASKPKQSGEDEPTTPIAVTTHLTKAITNKLSPSRRAHSILRHKRERDNASDASITMDEQTAAKLYEQAMQGDGPYDADSFPEQTLPTSPIMTNDATMIASNVSTPEQRERTLTDDTSNSNGSVSKHTLIRLMRDQVELVRNLTNAQVAQKKELERVREEKSMLEMQQQAQKVQFAPHRPVSTKLTLPTSVQRDSSDNRSLDTRSLARYFTRGSPKQSPRRHPDSRYYTNRSRAISGGTSPGNSPGNNYEENTLTNGNPSMASTIMPSAILIDSNKAKSTGAFGEADRPTYTGPGAYGCSKDKIEITHIPERNVVSDQENACISRMWWFFSRLCTLFIPDFLLCCIGRHAKITKGMSPEAKKEARSTRKEAKQAWREKVAIFIIMLFASACFIGVSGVIPMVLCRETTVFTMDEIQARDRAEDWTVIFGAIYDINDYSNVHPGGEEIRNLIAKDASKVFPRRPAGTLPSVCINRQLELSKEPECDEFDEVDQLVKLHCHSSIGFRGVNKAMGKYERGVFAHRLNDLQNDPYTDWFMIYNRIYNVTKYIDSIKDEESKEIDTESENAYLSKDLNKLIINKRGEDATLVYEALYEDDVALSCLDDLFYVGVLDEKDNVLCRALNIAMYSVMIIIAAVLAIQCLCSLLYLVRKKRTITREDTRSKIIVMVPCYSEGDKELSKTIGSVMDTSYPDDNKVLLVVADGNITGKGETYSTPEVLAKILGYTMNPSDRTYKCKSIGDLTENRAKLFYGIYKDAGKELKYLVIVKCGLPSEKGSARAGNRGKRDSQLLFTGLLNRFHHGRELNDLDKAIKNALDHMQLPLDEARYLMAIDADTRVDRESISHMTYSMNKNDHILALCGETKVDNKAQSWVTMIQVFEYYTNHHMKKAFESVFGCVTCLPGCFTMYRLFSDDGRPLLSCDDVYQRYATNNVKSLHDKNLYLLGEDRMLTTLLLRYFPDMKLSFVPEASCYTIVPDTFSVLLSQRRRWINSTFHNMLELMRVNTMCGVCCISMKSIVVLDLVATLILPASLIYIGYIVYITIWMGEPLSLLMLVIWGIVVGVQVVVFLLRSRWDYCWWFFVFILAGVPVFYFILPLYSFWHMDDFSWGATRQVSGPTLNSTKSRDETVSSERESPTGFEIVDSRVVDTNEYDRSAQRAVGRKMHQSAPMKANRGRHHHQKDSSVDEEVGRLNLKPKLHHSVPIDMDEVSAEEFSCELSATSKTKFNPKKYRDAEEAKKIRRLRRGEC